jgi:hypothetical protein
MANKCQSRVVITREKAHPLMGIGKEPVVVYCERERGHQKGDTTWKGYHRGKLGQMTLEWSTFKVKWKG